MKLFYYHGPQYSITPLPTPCRNCYHSLWGQCRIYYTTVCGVNVEYTNLMGSEYNLRPQFEEPIINYLQ